MRVCHLVATTLGATWMFEQLRELRDQHGYEVSAVVNSYEGPLVDLLRSESIPFHVCEFGLVGPSRARSMFFDIFRLARHFRAERYDVVQSHIFVTALVGRPAAWLAGVPARLAMIAGPFHLEAPASRLVERLTWWMDTTLVPSCEKSLRLCRAMGIPSSRLRLIYYPVDTVARFAPEQIAPSGLRAQFGWAEDTPVILLSAYFYPRLGDGGWIPSTLRGQAVKGHEDLIRAAPLVLQSFPNARFVLAGGAFAGATGFLDEMKALADEMGLGGLVVFTGHRSDVPAVLRDATIAVQASLCENLGGTLEALSMRKPMVVTRVGGMVDAVRDGETGLLANPRDPADLARKICELLKDPERAQRMGDRGRDLIEREFSLRKTATDLDTLYREEIARTQSRIPYSFSLGLLRVAYGIPWLAFVWLRARLQEQGGGWGRLMARGVAIRLRSRARLTVSAFERGAYKAWTVMAPIPIRRLARRMRRRRPAKASA